MSETQTVTAAKLGPKAPRRVRRPNRKTGKLPAPKVCGYAFSSDDLEAWAKKNNVFQDESGFNQQYGALQLIMNKLPDSFRWVAVRPHTSGIVLRCIVIGSNESKEDLIKAYTPSRAKRVLQALGREGEEPKWYYLREDFHSDS